MAREAWRLDMGVMVIEMFPADLAGVDARLSGGEKGPWFLHIISTILVLAVVFQVRGVASRVGVCGAEVTSNCLFGSTDTVD